MKNQSKSELISVIKWHWGQLNDEIKHWSDISEEKEKELQISSVQSLQSMLKIIRQQVKNKK